MRLSCLRYEAAEEIPWHFNDVPLEWSEQRWANCYRNLVFGRSWPPPLWFSWFW